MGLGRVFRKLGLPMWTFLGVGIAAIWFNYIGSLLERFTRDMMNIDETTRGFKTYLPPMLVFLIPFLIVFIALIWQKALYRIEKGRWIGKELIRPDGKRGLILLISNPDSAMFAVDYHFKQKRTLERVWLVPSNDQETGKFGPNTRAVADAIKQRCEELVEGGKRVQVEIHPHGVSPADSQDTFDYVNRIFRQGFYEVDDLIADFTGGTKPMSVGMIMACLPARRELEYVSFNPQTRESHGPFLIDYQHSAFDLVG
ncbi:MAG TPA: hypothetical protein VKC34_15855 [Blastocatellia bacterium]|nr:hypothetical protein [Blastocatellia bacterium]